MEVFFGVSDSGGAIPAVDDYNKPNHKAIIEVVLRFMREAGIPAVSSLVSWISYAAFSSKVLITAVF